MLRRSFNTVRIFSTFRPLRHLTSKPLQLVNPAVNPVSGQQLNLISPKLSQLLSKCPTLAQRNLSANDFYQEGINALKARCFDDAYLLWKEAFDKKISIYNHHYLEQIIEHVQMLKIELSQTHFDLFAINHHRLKDVWMAMYYLTDTKLTVEKNTFILNTLLNRIAETSHLVDVLLWLKRANILTDKNKETLINHIEISEQLLPFLNFSIFKMDTENLSEQKQKFFHTLVDNLHHISRISSEEIYPVISQNRLEKLIEDAKKVELVNPNKLK